ncbi:MAG: UDP-4-amino-4,6-dideoxy-N-acetyl-beta-L-altrosamine transaminase [Kordiimonas sp.]|nr:UDP-4-amino-4,6-dideoxy-N-acetyl-beta-L-altrosamine transaminase [Kordiimonas sp.]
MIPYGRQDISQQDIDAVVDVLKSDFLTQGPQVPAFEAAVANYCGAAHAFAMNSATSALHVACLALEVGPGDVVWTSPVTFVASANAARYCGADVDFVDIDPVTYTLSAEALARKLATTKAQGGRLPKVVIPVHLCGQSCDMEAIAALAEEYGFAIIEDAAHAIGGTYQDRPIGSCAYADIAVFSFHPVKIITTAEGGMAVTNRDDLAARMALLRSHGVTRDETLMTKPSEGPWYYQQIELGYNYRMTELQAALGSSQMARLGPFVADRNRLADRYDDLLAAFPVITPRQSPACYSARHLYVICLNLDEITATHREVFESLRSAGIGVNLHYIPVHLQPYYQALGFKEGDFPVAEDYYQKAISIPLFHHMTEAQQDQVVDALHQALR